MDKTTEIKVRAEIGRLNRGAKRQQFKNSKRVI